MQLSRVLRIALNSLAIFALQVTAPAHATDYETPLAAIAATSQLSDMYGLIKKTGYAEPMSTGGDITFLALTNRLVNQNTKNARFSFIEFVRDKLPPEGQLLVMQALTIDGQFTQAQLEEMVATQGNGKAVLPTVLGKDAKYKLYRGKNPGTFVLEDVYHNGTLLDMSKAIVTQNGTVVVVDENAEIPK